MRALEPGEVVVDDEVIGLYTLAGLGAPPAVPVPTVDWLMSGPQLAVPPPRGPRIDDPQRIGAFARQLSTLLGGPFVTDLRPYITLAMGLVSPAERDKYGLSDTTEPYGWLGLAHDGWHVQALAAPEGQHLVAFIRPLAPVQAIDSGGSPHYRPLGEPRDLLAVLAPVVKIDGDDSGSFPSNVFDAVLTGPAVRIRCGVRRIHNSEYSYILHLDR